MNRDVVADARDVGLIAVTDYNLLVYPTILANFFS